MVEKGLRLAAFLRANHGKHPFILFVVLGIWQPKRS